MTTIDDRVTRLESINEQQMSKVVNGLEALVLLREDAKEKKEFSINNTKRGILNS